MTNMEKFIEETFNTLRLASRDEQILARLSRFGYDDAHLQEGLTLNQNAQQQVQMQQQLRMDKENTSQIFMQQWATARQHFAVDIKMARVALKEIRSARHLFALEFSQIRQYEEWYRHVKAFYNGLRDLPGLLALVQPLGLTSERIEQGIQSLQSLDQLYQEELAQSDRLALIQQQRDAAYGDIYQWMITFRKVARAGLANNPLYLARLGLNARSRKAASKGDVSTETAIPTIALMDSVSLAASA